MAAPPLPPGDSSQALSLGQLPVLSVSHASTAPGASDSVGVSDCSPSLLQLPEEVAFVFEHVAPYIVSSPNQGSKEDFESVQCWWECPSSV